MNNNPTILATYLQDTNDEPWQPAMHDLTNLKNCRDAIDDDAWKAAYDKEIEFQHKVLTRLL